MVHAKATLLYRVVHGSPSLEQVPVEVRRLIERCLAKDPSQRPTADGLLAEVGALQPTANWLPESIILAFARDAQPDPAPAAPAPALGSLAALGFIGQSATQTTAAGGRGHAQPAPAAARRGDGGHQGLPRGDVIFVAHAGLDNTGPGRASPVPAATLDTFHAPYAGSPSRLHFQARHRFHGLHLDFEGSALPFARPGADE